MENNDSKPPKKNLFVRIILLIIILATIFSLYLTVKLILEGFTFR